jgi:hypothetical protein
MTLSQLQRAMRLANSHVYNYSHHSTWAVTQHEPLIFEELSMTTNASKQVINSNFLYFSSYIIHANVYMIRCFTGSDLSTTSNPTSRL